MKTKKTHKIVQTTFVFLCLNLSLYVAAQIIPPPFAIKEGLFDTANNINLGLEKIPGSQTYTIFKPTSLDNTYNHGVVVLPFKGKLYAQWQTSAKDEDAPDTHVVYSVSDDGKTWSKIKTLEPKWDKGIKTSGGWWTDGKTLVAYINVWPTQPNKPRGGYVEYRTSTDGITWTESKPVLDVDGKPLNGIFEQDPHALKDGRIISAVHEQPGLIVAPYYTDDPLGVTRWTKGKMKNIPSTSSVSQELEPSWYQKANGDIVMVFRDQGGSYKRLAAISYDRGENWTTPVITNMPDSRSKQSAGNLPNGVSYLVGNPTGTASRYPLAIALSKDGSLFDKAFVIRTGDSDMDEVRFEGKYKRPGYSYPKSVLWGDYLCVAYGTNKEVAQVTLIPLKSLEY